MNPIRGEEAVSPVIATVLLVLIVVGISATVFVLTNGFAERSSEPSPHVAMVTDNGASTVVQWKLAFQSAVPPRPMDQFLFVLRTPQNGTLVADPSTQVVDHQMDFYWELPQGAGTGRHVDRGDTVGTSAGGFHLRLVDLDGDGRLGGGDRMFIWYDANGDQRHATGADDAWPTGTYTLEIKHQKSESYVAFETRSF